MKNFLSTALRLLVTVEISLISTIVISFVVSEIILQWYMYHYGITIRADLSEDYGFGMLVFFGVLITALFAFPISLYYAWGPASSGMR